ncbi:mitochondrial fission process protein 1-like [Ctenocephalides felis]|uniref:mitochondrial fission process protein 1-like n=1 Tax=Ctenocephalides felis TaxID=7515 RepID=UPI000E6E2677|nr:mitochondrial fission process protein 1-like [Ctenocephalides felis]
MDTNNGRDDAFRRAPLRYMGLSYEILFTAFPLFTWRIFPIGQSLRNVYISMDVMDKSYPKFKTQGSASALVTGGDAFLWQSLASIAIPGISLRFVRKVVFSLFKSPPLSQILTLATIPAIVPFGDDVTESLMNLSYREIFGKSY